MRKWVWRATNAMALALLAGCVPLMVGGAAVVVTDQVMEDRNGGDGLF